MPRFRSRDCGKVMVVGGAAHPKWFCVEAGAVAADLSSLPDRENFNEHLMMCDLRNKTTTVAAASALSSLLFSSPRQSVADAAGEDAMRGAERSPVIDLQFKVVRVCVAGDDEQRM